MDRTEKQKMLVGELYIAADSELVALRQRARNLTQAFNQTSTSEILKRQEILSRLFGSIGDRIEIEPPFYCDYGCHIFAGDGLFMNFNCVILDCNTVHIGENVMMGPCVQIYTAYHPLQAEERIKGPELAAPIRIGDNVWLGGNAIICPGVSIGNNTTIGAGSVVTKDIPANVFAAGNPCRVIRTIQ